MAKLLPFSFLLCFASFFGLSWIVTGVDPQTASPKILLAFVFLLFTAVFCLLGIVLYFLRTRFKKHYSPSWYIKTSFKMSFFIALFIALLAGLTILHIISLFNILLVIAALSLFAFYSYLGKRTAKGKEL